MDMSKYTVQDFVKDCKALFEKNKEAILKKENFMEAMLQDGKTKIYYEGETPQPNMPVFVIDEKGNQVPLMAGNHTMQDGTMLIVKQDGVIAEVQGKTPETPEAPATGNPNDEIMADEKTLTPQAKTVIESIVKEQRFEMEKAFDEKLKAHKDEFEKTIKANDEKVVKLEKEKAELEAKFTKQTEQNMELFELVKKLGDEPATTTAKKKDEKKEEDKPMKVGLDVWKK